MGKKAESDQIATPTPELRADDQAKDVGWVHIPPLILAAEDLCMGEKVLYGRIVGFSKKLGKCFATNEWFSQQLGLTKNTVSAYVSNLVRKGYLLRSYGTNGKQSRALYLPPNALTKGGNNREK